MKRLWLKGFIFYKRHTMSVYLGAISFWLASLSVCVFLSLLHPTIVTYNPSHTIHLFSKEMAEAHLNAMETKQLSKRFSQGLKATLLHYAHLHHVTILKNDGAIVSEKDITPEIEEALANRMQDNS
jgi:type-F conjugative transfer system protein TrbI